MDIEQMIRESVDRYVAAYFTTAPALRAMGLEAREVPTAPKVKRPAKKAAKAKLVHLQPTNAETNVLAALANGHETAGTIAAYTEGVLNARQAGQTLKRLVDQGLVTKQGERRFTTYHAVAQNGAAS